MNYYIDFDNTLYETSSLTKSMLEIIENTVSDKIGKENKEELELVKSSFNSSNDNIYEYVEKVATKYGIDNKYMLEKVRKTISDGERFVYEDVKGFLENLKSSGNKITLLTFVTKTNQDYQLQKIKGSGLANYFDTIIITTELKYTLDLNYENGIFIDDNPRDLEGLNSMNPLRLIRIRRSTNKYSKTEMNIETMEEYESFSEISLDFNK